METTINRVVTLALIIAMIFLTAMVLTNRTYGSAPSGLPATIASSSVATLAAVTSTVLIATSTCSARIITTKASPIILTFSDYSNQSPSGTFGHLQPASTTVAYDSGQYGCGLVKAYAFVADTVTVTDVR